MHMWDFNLLLRALALLPFSSLISGTPGGTCTPRQPSRGAAAARWRRADVRALGGGGGVVRKLTLS
eukprot:scaffold26893_cov120-Isochrysis_galbana.AAC.3